MGLLTSIWRRITYTKALEESNGKMETAFFESVYRVIYIAGFSNSDRGFFYQLYSNTVKLIIGLFLMSEGWYMISVPSLDVIVEQMNLLLIQSTAVFRYNYMRAHQECYPKLAASMQLSNWDMSTPARKALVKFWTEKNESYLKLVIGSGTATLAVWYVYPMVDNFEYNLPVNVGLPMDYRTPTLYPVAYLTAVIGFHSTAFFVVVHDVILQAHLMYLICHYSVLADCFENILVDCEKEFEGLSRNELLYNSDFREAYISRLGLLVKQHKQLLFHTMELRKTISLPMLGQVSASALQICFAAYQVALTLTVNLPKFVLNLMFLGYNMCEMFVICRWCDEIQIQTANISWALYCSGWECGVAAMTGVRARLLLVATCASKPVVLTAGGIYDLSLNSYANLVKTSYSAFTVLLNTRHG